jgi:nucleotide-binding universal stress UspA family protein
MTMNTRVAARPILVGVDGSAAGTAGLGWAAAEARRRSAPLRVVHVVEQRHSDAFTRANPVYVAEERRAAEQVLDAAVGYVHGLGADVDVRPTLEIGSPAVVLLAHSATAEMVVVGSRGRGGFAGLLLGSTSLHVATHAPCPVVVLRGAPGPVGPADRIVVGVDGSPSSELAVRFAFTRAQRTGRGLTAVHAWRPPIGHIDVRWSGGGEQAEKEERTLLAERLVPWRERYPEVDVVEKTVRGSAAAVLIDAPAELLVVGSHGRGGFGGLLLGSVSHAVLHHARCPVAVVRQ